MINLGVSVHEAQNDQKSIDMVSHYTFDIVFMDIQMLYIGGFEATIQIRNISPEASIIAQSGESRAKEVARIHQLMDDRIVKPATLY
ncbi:response regulator [Vibrio gazogenes]|uniref:Response regulatory domain-containing protein n=1 Tax=Vibrio gazogenes TaxID=687 RepID=A0A1Z2SI44_VIBGA|nr:response regulator [Vibrio gazogenes]ASA56841.1 hypothetical protein BSQ33_14830 [Vibrio gazogenes]